MSATLPRDIIYSDLSPEQVAFLRTTVPPDAARNGFQANITTAQQSNGLMTVKINFSTGGNTPVTTSAALTARPPITAPAMSPVPLASSDPVTIQSGMTWFKQKFGTQINTKLTGTPYSIDLMTAIAVQETFDIWGNLFRNTELADLLKLCVGDTIDAPARTAFPADKADLLAAPNGASLFLVARQALEAVGGVNAAYHKLAAANPDKFCHGFGIFQYDLQHGKTNPGYFFNHGWYDFGTCLALALQELDEARIRAYGAGKVTLTQQEMVYVAIAYNHGSVNLNAGFKQGYEDFVRKILR